MLSKAVMRDRGNQSRQEQAFSYVDVESRIPAGHPIRKIRKVVYRALAGMDDVFDTMYAETGRPSIPPEQLLRALVVQMIHTIRSERKFPLSDELIECRLLRKVRNRA